MFTHLVYAADTVFQKTGSLCLSFLSVVGMSHAPPRVGEVLVKIGKKVIRWWAPRYSTIG